MPENRIAFLRHRAEMSQVDVAAQLRVSENSVRRWELGDLGIADKNKLALASLFDVSVSFLMGWTDAGSESHSEAAA